MVLGISGDILGNVVWFLLFIVFMYFYPRLLISQTLLKLEQSAMMLEGLSGKAKKIVISKISKNPTKELREKVSNFLEFFVIEPVSLDPFGIVKKIEHVVNLAEKRFKYFAKEVAPKMDSEEQANLVVGISGAMSLHQISKIVRHFVELVRKTKNLQLALILQMQLPLIERIAKALLNGTEALTNGWTIGDAIGPLVAANMIGTAKTKEIEEDTLLARKKIRGRNVLLIKAKGPGGRLGKLGKAVEKITKTQKISKIITIDAAAKLEGEKTGGVAEGIGVAIGGIGVDRAYIEEIATKSEIPLDSVVIKMSQEEAIQPMMKEVLHATGKVQKIVEGNIARTAGTIIVVGVGNTGGVGNDKKSADATAKKVEEILKMLKARKEEKKKNKLLDWVTGM